MSLLNLAPMMHRLRQPRSLNDRIFILFACAALLLRAVVPDGFMVERSVHSGGLTIMLCTARGLVPASTQPDRHSSGGEHGSPTSVEGACAFAIALSPVVPPAVQTAVIVAESDNHDFGEPRNQIVPNGYRATRRARAPPIHS
jgi:hypothetical protein